MCGRRAVATPRGRGRAREEQPRGAPSSMARADRGAHRRPGGARRVPRRPLALLSERVLELLNALPLRRSTPSELGDRENVLVSSPHRVLLPRGQDSARLAASAHARAGLPVERVWIALDILEIRARLGFEPQHDTAGTNALEAHRDPVLEIERRARHRGVVVASRVILDPLRSCFEVRQPELACRGLQERLLLVHRLQRNELDLGQRHRRDHDRNAAAGSDIENIRETAEVRYHVKAVLDMRADLGACRRRREVDTAVPLLEKIEEAFVITQVHGSHNSWLAFGTTTTRLVCPITPATSAPYS